MLDPMALAFVNLLGGFQVDVGFVCVVLTLRMLLLR